VGKVRPVTTTLLERRQEVGGGGQEQPRPAAPRPQPQPSRPDGGGPAGTGGGGGDGGRRQWPLLPALLAAAVVGALLTFLGMLTQIWANMAGAQLPGA
jgi:hypothetical protein